MAIKRAKGNTGKSSAAKARLNPTHNDLPTDVRHAVVNLLAPYLASAVDLHWQAKQAHWNVKGPNFIGLHELFDRVAEAVDGWADLLAERVVQLGGVAEGTVQVAAGRSALPAYPLDILRWSDHVEALSSSLAAFGRLVREGIDQAGELGDQDTADLCTEISREVDKFVWFVEAHNP
ncbi:DNA protection during starvation protein [Calidithermus terrae]|uniref:DNA protection during starvation protein n=1 Tax=Calidithermus terrae TaxID=1408545 RepID=A0A399F495_9DEIN|nr:DNA starvation/stationary phase protection protein Dps [Calidithermus terrae]RIH90605.1 DNA protection during starvation protein [Calidithermus terrae]